MTAAFKVACIQNCAEDVPAANIPAVTAMVRDAAAAGAQLVCLPENFACLEERDDLYTVRGFDAASHPAL